MTYDPAVIAKAELAWWIARRIPGKDSPEQVGALIADLNAQFYGVPREKVLEASILRARAGRLRDEGGPGRELAGDRAAPDGLVSIAAHGSQLTNRLASARSQILEWAEQGAMSPDNVRALWRSQARLPTRAMAPICVRASAVARRAALLAAGVIFFFAYNWDAIGRFAKFGLVEGLLVASVVAAWLAGPGQDRGQGVAASRQHAHGRAARARRADVSDRRGYFRAVCVVGRADPAVDDRCHERPRCGCCSSRCSISRSRSTFGVPRRPWNALSFRRRLTRLGAGRARRRRLVVWEVGTVARLLLDAGPLARAPARGGQRDGDHLPRTLGRLRIIGRESARHSGVYCAWLVGAYFYYRRHTRDLFVLAGGVLSVIVVRRVVALSTLCWPSRRRLASCSSASSSSRCPRPARGG